MIFLAPFMFDKGMIVFAEILGVLYLHTLFLKIERNMAIKKYY
mgnify:CR=1 FL=1